MRAVLPNPHLQHCSLLHVVLDDWQRARQLEPPTDGCRKGGDRVSEMRSSCPSGKWRLKRRLQVVLASWWRACLLQRAHRKSSDDDASPVLQRMCRRLDQRRRREARRCLRAGCRSLQSSVGAQIVVYPSGPYLGADALHSVLKRSLFSFTLRVMGCWRLLAITSAKSRSWSIAQRLLALNSRLLQEDRSKNFDLAASRIAHLLIKATRRGKDRQMSGAFHAIASAAFTRERVSGPSLSALESTCASPSPISQSRARGRVFASCGGESSGCIAVSEMESCVDGGEDTSLFVHCQLDFDTSQVSGAAIAHD